MKKSIGSKFLLFVLLTVLAISGCAPAPTPEPTSTPVPPTFTPEPTATSTPIPPSPTPTEPLGPTPSGKFEFFDVTLDQAGKDTVNISFGYQLEKGLDPSGLQIMAQLPTKGTSISCNTMNFSTFAKPYILKGDVSGIVKGADAASISMTEPAKCSFKGFTLIVFRVEGSAPVTLYKQDFEIPFDLEK